MIISLVTLGPIALFGKNNLSSSSEKAIKIIESALKILHD